ncbi:TIR domain-containing protein [Reichenbachiella sp. MALMAid0571]|uniref:TIR domain-containing protein n=1 Tax=Reichenbachiella sp. MALMAid0571 TaxID=3143939 RepID=UPI0032DF2F42
MPELHRYRLFISHAWHRHEGYDRMIQFLNDAPNFIYSNYSVPIDKAFDKMSTSQLEDQIKQQIRPVECVIILGGVYVSYSSWIQFEIDFAKSLRKPIIGVQPWGSQRMPLAVQNAANIIVGWNTSSIVKAIRDYSI